MIQGPKKWRAAERMFGDRHFSCEPQPAGDLDVQGRCNRPFVRTFEHWGGLFMSGFYNNWASYWHLVSRRLG